MIKTFCRFYFEKDNSPQGFLIPRPQGHGVAEKVNFISSVQKTMQTFKASLDAMVWHCRRSDVRRQLPRLHGHCLAPGCETFKNLIAREHALTRGRPREMSILSYRQMNDFCRRILPSRGESVPEEGHRVGSDGGRGRQTQKQGEKKERKLETSESK